MDGKVANFMTITAVSRATGYAISTIRELADSGVIKVPRTDTGVRLFTQEDVGRLLARRENNAQRAHRYQKA